LRHRGLHRRTGDHGRVAHAVPFVVPDELGVDGCYIGREASGGCSVSTRGSATQGQADSPNIVVFGQIGRGKSAFVKSFCGGSFASAPVLVLDPKASTAAWPACGVAPLRLGPGLGLRLNPLDVGPLDVGPLDVGPLDVGPLDVGRWTAGHRNRRPGAETGWAPATRPVRTTGALLSSSLGRSLQPEERARRRLFERSGAAHAVPTLGAVARRSWPEPGQAAALAPTSKDYATMAPGRARVAAPGRGRPGRHVRRETSPGIDMAGGMVVLDLSRCTPLPRSVC